MAEPPTIVLADDNDGESETENLISPPSSSSGFSNLPNFHADWPISPFPHKPGHGLKLVWENLCILTPNKKRQLLFDLTGFAQGSLTAILGPTGAGKTTLMNSLAYRANGVILTKGAMELDGKGYDYHVLKGVSGYVMQDDIVFENLTVFETLLYAGRLRLPRSMTEEERLQRIEETLLLMQLNNCRDLLVGNPRNQGISGSERKRLCVAIELLMRPRLLFLDEPTTGLDSAAAYSLMSILRDLARSGGCTIVSTIHQPQAKIVELFENLIVLYEGKLVYSGPAAEVSNHYAQAGFPCPLGANPADHLMEVITPMTSEQRDEVRQNAEKLIQVQNAREQALIATDPSAAESKLQGLPGKIDKGYRRIRWFLQFWILLVRSLLLQIRAYSDLIVEFIQVIISAILIGTAFLDIGVTQKSYQKRIASIFFITINQGSICSMIAINQFPSERAMIIRERSAGTYAVSAYFLGKVLCDMVVQVLYPIIFSVIVYWLIGYQADAGKFIIFIIIVVLLHFCGFAMANLVASVGRTTGMSLAILPLVMEINRLFGGFFMPPSQLPSYFVWLDAIDFIKYGYIGLALNELEGLEYVCDPTISNACTYQNGEQVIAFFGYDQFTVGSCIGILIAFLIGFRFLNYVAIRYLK